MSKAESIEDASAHLESSAPVIGWEAADDDVSAAAIGTDSDTAVSGTFDGLDGRYAVGWARDDVQLTVPVPIEILADERWVAEGVANVLRGDLLDAGIGDGKHGFRIALPSELCDGKPHEIRVRAGAKRVELSPGDRHIFQQSSSIRGRIDGVEGPYVVGTVRSLFPSEEALHVELQVDGRSVATGAADQKTGDGCRFSLRLPPDAMDGRPHLISVHVTNPFLLLGETAAILPSVLTPTDVLRRHSGGLTRAALLDGAAGRYESLRNQLKQLTRGDSPLSADEKLERLRQIALAHEQVIRGFDGIDSESPLAPLVFPDVPQPLVSVVIPVHNKVRVTHNCLASLLLAPNHAAFEVIVVDDGSSDATLQLPEITTGVRFVRHQEAQGFVRSCNDGAKLARGAYVALLNNDTEVTPWWIDELVHVFEHFPGVGMAGGKLTYPDGKLQEAGGIVWNNGDPWNYGRNGNAGDPRFNYTRQVDYISGACIMLPKPLWDDLGGFDEHFAPAYFEDTDLAFRVRERGLKTVYAPFSQVVHFEGISSGTTIASGMKRFQEVNRPKFKRRWTRAFRNNGVPGRDPDLNKDRNVNFRVLVIDYATPRPDRDAGSYAAVQEMRLLQSLGFKVTFIPDNVAYLADRTEALQRAGVECVYAPFALTVQEVLEKRGGEFDLIYLTRYSIAERHIDSIRRFAPQAKVVFNNADLHFLRELRAAIAARSESGITQAVKTRDEELALMRKVDLVLSYNETEHAVIVSHNLTSTRVAKCPWIIELPTETPSFEQRHGMAFLGGFSHHPNVDAVEYFVREVMPVVRQLVPNVPLRIYGSDVPDRLKELAAEDVLIEGWVPDVATIYEKCRVFIAPLRSGAGLKGKVISAFAYGVPCVLSPIAAEGTGARDGQEALIAETPQQWADCIAKLHEERKTWRQLHQAARRHAASEFNFEKGQRLMQAALAMVDIYATPDESVLLAR